MKKLQTKQFNIDDFINELKSNPLLENYKVDLNNCNTLFNYVCSYTNCQNCKGLDECKNKSVGYSVSLKEEYPYQAILHPCKYEKTRLENEKAKKRFNALYLPNKILEANFDDYRLDSETRTKVYKYAVNFSTAFKRGNGAKGLYVCGDFQIGKTYFLGACANLFAQNGIDTIMIYVPDLIRELKNNMSKTDFENKINMLKSVDVLMLDDLGAELTSTWVRDEILCPILNYRLQEGLPVFISSNYTFNGLKDFYLNIDGSQNGASRLISRIKGLTNYVEF